MKWLNRIIGKQEQQKTHTIAFHELETWVADESKAELDEFFKNAAQIFAEIEKTKEQLVRDIKILETSDPPEVPPHVLRRGLTARDNMIKYINVLIDRISIPSMDYSDIRDFYATAETNIETTLEKSLKSHQFAKYVFPEEVSTIVSDISDIKKSLIKLRQLFDGDGGRIENFAMISEGVQRIKDMKDDLVRCESRIVSVDAERDDIQHEIVDCTAGMERLADSSEWQSFVELEAGLKRAEGEKNRIETSVAELFMPLNKALNRMKKQDTSGRHTLSIKQKELLDICLENPISADADDITDFLTGVHKLVESDVLGLKDKKRDKIVDQIKHIMDSFESKKDQYNIFDSQISEIERQISDFAIMETKTALERQLDANTMKIKQIEEELTDLDGELKMRSEELENQKKNLSNAMNSIKPMQIIFD